MDVRSPALWLPLAALALSPLQLRAAGPDDDVATTKKDVWSQEQLEAVSDKIRKQIEDLRGQEFKHAVKVELQDKEGLVEYMKKRQDEFVPEAIRVAEEELAKLLGMVPPTLDLQATLTEVIEEQVGGFYDPASDAFYLMESFTGDLAEIILAHELTHALDDQYYDLDGKLKTLLDSTDAIEAYRSVIEGSATYAMQSWMMKFGMQLDRQALIDSQSVGMGGLDDAPPFIWKPLISAYMTGMGFMAAGDKSMDDEEGEDYIRQAFVEPPSTMEQVLHPEKYWNPELRDEPRKVSFDLEGLSEGWEVLKEDTYGELYLALMTAPADKRGGLDASNPMALIALKYTNDAAKGWDGDRVVLLGNGDARFARLVTAWDSATDATEFRIACEEAFKGLGNDGWDVAPVRTAKGQVDDTVVVVDVLMGEGAEGVVGVDWTVEG